MNIKEKDINNILFLLYKLFYIKYNKCNGSDVMNKFVKKNEPIVIVNKDFKRCILFISFPIEEATDVLIAILKSMAFDRSAIYDTDKKIYEININNYCLSYRGEVTSIGNNYFLELTLSFPCYDSLGKDVLLDNLKFVREIIYNPYLEDGKFPIRDIEDIKSIIKNNVNRNFKDALWYFRYRNDKIIDEDNYLRDIVADDPNLLDNITSDDIYNLYKKIISRPPIVFLIGNVDRFSAEKKIREILLNDKKEYVVFEKKYNYYCKNISNIPEEIIEKVNFKSTGLAYNYKVKDLKDEKDIALLKIIKMIFNSTSSRLLYDTLRRDNDLVYRCGAYVYSTFGSLTIWAMIGKDNIDNVKINFDKLMKDISDINFIEEKLNLIKEEIKLDDDLVKENIHTILMRSVDKYIECKEKTFYEIIKDISSLEVKRFIDNRLVLVSKYIGVGEEDE